ncbi:MAG: ABC transporter permease [Lachnospiraceae bacterium]|nr:ABC transporter permease [Lachnospiraceae bacterium]MDE7272615.1 ABC transporter permease [Lachnospiraceae bacterium]
MELFLLEHEKLWRRGTTKVCVFLCFVYVVLIGSVLSYQWFAFGSSTHTDSFGNHFDGYDMIRDSQEYSRSFGGELTDESFQQMVKAYQEIKAGGMDRELQITNQYKLQSWLDTLYPELKDSSTYQPMLSYVNPDELTGFYERRQKAIEKFLEISGQEGSEKEYLMQIEQKVQKPFRYEWTEGWSLVLSSIVGELGIVMALFLATALSPLFAGEWYNGTNILILTTKNGWRETAFAKILAGLCFTLEFFAILAAGEIAAQLFFMGTTGWDMPIQNIKLIAIAPMNMLQAEIYEYAFTLLGAIGYAGIVMLLSAIVKSNVLALLSSLAAVYAPMMLERYLPFWMQKAKDLVPLVGSGTDIFRTNTLCIFGRYIWSPYLLVTVPGMIGLLCIPFAVKGWSRRLKV